jgi:hypothetical protein
MTKPRYVTNLPDNKNEPFGGAFSVYDDATVATRNQAIEEYSKKSNFFDHDQVRKDFLGTYKEWAFSSHPKITGIEGYNELCFTNGTTESFAMFYLRYREQKRLRLAKGEYFYSQMMSRLWYSDRFAWLNEDDIRKGDVLLLSVPFADTGDVPYDLERLLTECDEKEVPVMLDFAYLNLATGFQVDVTHPCIEYIVTSLSKVFPVEHFRIGMRMQRKMFTDQLYVINEDNYNYINLLSAHVGTKLMLEHGADYIFEKYRSKQKELCEKYELEVSPCVYFGIDKNNNFPLYNRGNDTNRLCFTKIWDGRMKEPR